MPSCDVIIPTYNSEATIKPTLSALLAQKYPSNWKIKIIISDDGSRDQTVDLAQKILSSYKLSSFSIISHSHVGAAAARNRALKSSCSDLVFFLGADIILRPYALAEHFTYHQQYSQNNYAALGVVVWDPLIKPSPFMEWLVHGGPQNDFDSIMHSNFADPSRYFYGSHLSLKRSFLESSFFSEQFHGYGWEDLELGSRLADQGLRLKVLSQAIGHHRHLNSLSAVFRRQKTIGYNLYLWHKQRPDLGLIPSSSFVKRLKRRLFYWSGARFCLYILLQCTYRYFSTPKLFAIITASAFWDGIKKAENSQKV